jgi:predicted NBD/HSP70 family sugar kinase
LVLQTIVDRGPISRAELARTTELGKATVSDIAGALIGEGLVVEVGRGTSTGGKPPTLLELDPEGRFAVGVDLSRRPFEAALLNLRGRIVARQQGKALAPEGRDAVEEVHRLVTNLIGVAGAPALGIGLAVPGAVSDDGVVVAAESLGWSDLDLQSALEDVYEIPTHIAGDAEAAALAEFGRSRSAADADLLYVKVDDRITVAIVSSGEIHRASRRGGELTHLSVPGSLEECSCGRRGCLGTVVSVTAMLGADFAELSSEARTSLGAETEPDVGPAARALGGVLAPIIAAIDIDHVVLGGSLAAWDVVAPLVTSSVEDTLGWAPAVVVSQLRATAAVLGAGGMVLSAELGVVWG